MKKVCIAILFFLASCSTDPKAVKIREMKDRLDKLHNKIEWYINMRDKIWSLQNDLGRLKEHEYVDTLISISNMMKREMALRDSIKILQGIDPDAWKKPPSE